ncbi:GNAT family N-acetyltransferase [Hyphococcus sp.]|uniref:GNAT family N-acetyltransferase n=1 Tax=Hyphococcus sp. TaxID=2038636 RepID=UPI003CCC1E76
MTLRYSPLSRTAKTGDQVEVTITYMEQQSRPALAPAPPAGRGKAALLRAENPPVHYYRYLYGLIGGPHNWVSRRKLTDEDLAAIIRHEEVYLYILYIDGVPAGMAEIDARARDTHELKFFGLAPDFTGKGLGRFFLSNILDLVWSRNPPRVRLETCTLDHPAALPLYQKLGFSVIGRRQGFVEVLPPPDVSSS